jgi:hypothetical protein
LTLSSTVAPGVPPVVDEASMLRRALEIFAHDRLALTGWLRSFDEAERALDVACRSYWHPNGFAKLVLQAGEDHKVRLHVWPTGANRRGESNPHGHRWNFASIVLCGDGLRDVHYTEAEEGDKYERYQYAGGNGVPDREDTVCLAAGETHVRGVGVRYALDTSVVHTVHPLGTALIATLVLQGAPRLDYAPVYGLIGDDVDEPGRAITADEVRGLIRDVLDAQR